MNRTLLIFSKNLIYGEVKTRLAATVGNHIAMNIYRYLLRYSCNITKSLPLSKIVFYSNNIEKEDIWIDEVYQKQLQSGGNLGERMLNAFLCTFHKGCDKAVIIGTDCLDLTPAIIMNAYVYLKDYDIVIGPAKDGGYYLLGMKQLNEQLFKNISWSTGEVLHQTLAICESLKLSVYQLPILSDIDNEDDLNNIEEQWLRINKPGI